MVTVPVSVWRKMMYKKSWHSNTELDINLLKSNYTFKLISFWNFNPKSIFVVTITIPLFLLKSSIFFISIFEFFSSKNTKGSSKNHNILSENLNFWIEIHFLCPSLREDTSSSINWERLNSVSYSHLTLPTNREV